MQKRQLLVQASAALGAAFLPLEPARAAVRRPIGYLRTNWSRDPYALGAYSFFKTGSWPSDRRVLEAPVNGRLFFAGEAAHPTHSSTVHAAHLSGLRAAEAIVKVAAQKVIVIGAGMAGVTAAQALAAAGRDVTVLEARNRIGGRILTDSSLGPALDLGASWIHGLRRNPLVPLAERARMKMAATGDDYIIRGANGRRVSPLAAPAWLETVSEIEHSYGADADDLNFEASDAEAYFQGADVVFPKGYSEIFQSLTGPYDLRLREVVTRIDYRRDTPRVTVGQGATYEADVVLVTVPLGVLQAGRIQFTPALPKAKEAAIRKLGMGLLDKVYLLYDAPFWDVDKTWILTPETGLPRGQFNQWLNLTAFLSTPVLLAFNAGSAARALSPLPDDAVLDAAFDVLATAYPE